MTSSAHKGAGALSEFAKWAITEGAFTGGDLSGGEIQDMAVELGLLREVPYDPAQHGESEFGTEPGDSWFEFAGPLKDGLPLPAASGAASGWMDGPWRVGNHYGIHVYEGDRPVATFHTPQDAALAVRAVALHRATTHVELPASVDQALLMQALGLKYLLDHAPDRLTDEGRAEAAAIAIAASRIPPSVDGLDAGEKDRLPRGVAGAAETAQAALEALRKRIHQLDRRSFILTPEDNGVRAVKDACGHWLELHEVIALFEAAIGRASTGEAATDARRDAFMAGRQSVRGINRSYSEQAWQAYLALEGKSNG